MTSTLPTRPTLTARSPEDVLAATRVVLGFEPADSLVMLTFGGRHTFHARVDLPEPAAGLGELTTFAEAMGRPVVHHGVESVFPVLFTPDARLAQRVVSRLRRELRRHGVTCHEALRAHGGRWYPVVDGGRGAPVGGVRYEVSGHPFVVAAVLDGRVIHGSRKELAATIAPDEEAVAVVTAARETSTREPATAAWVTATLERHVASGTQPDPEESARLLQTIATPVLRDAAWADVSRERARAHVALWTVLVRGCPGDLVGHAAAVLGFLAWLAGDGALAWCAVDRARAADPDHSLAALVADLLEGAVPPSAWDEGAHPWGSVS